MTRISEIKEAERKKIQKRLEEKLEKLQKKTTKKRSSKKKSTKKSPLKKKVNKNTPPSKKQIDSLIRHIKNILSRDNLSLDSNEEHKLESAFKIYKFDKYYQPHFIPGGKNTVKNGKKIDWQKSVDMQLDDKISLFIKDGGLRDSERIDALIEEIS